nr:sigma 54-interacting transcriptional regulator [Natranaerofaba carboxydovora]
MLDAILNSTHDGIYIVDSEGKFIEANKGIERISGYKRDKLLGKTGLDLVEMGLIDESVTSKVFKTKKQMSILQTLKHDVVKEVLVTATPIMDKNNNIKYIVATLRDLTELINLKYECEKSKELTNQYFSQLQREKRTNKDIIANSAEMKKTLEIIERIAATETTVLLSGESGTGKDVMARLIHNSSSRSEKNFVTINCAAIPESLLESELFGYEGGSFTGAKTKGKVGSFGLADKGTLFLDEIGSFPLNLQGKLLRALETFEIQPIGAEKSKNVDVRIIAATNQDLEQLVKEGKFREDLFFRLNVVPITLPSLRDRREDIVPLIMYYLKKYNEKYKRKVAFEKEVFEIAENYSWPGNIRELRNIVERLVVISQEERIDYSHLPNKMLEEQSINSSCSINIQEILPLDNLLHEAEKALLNKAFLKYKTTRKIAKALGISQTSVVRKLKKYNIN